MSTPFFYILLFSWQKIIPNTWNYHDILTETSTKKSPYFLFQDPNFSHVKD